MRSLLIILLLFLFWLCTSCNSDNPENDSDNLPLNDIDSVVGVDKDSVEVIDDDLSDEALSDKEDTDSEILTDTDEINTDTDSVKQDKDITPDKDTAVDEDVEIPDYDYPAGTDGDPDCPSLLNAGFPYKDGEGKLTFCRKCDLPAPANDPQCVRNLWEMNNRRIIEEYPKKYCYPLPCDVTDKAIKNDSSILGKCDFDAESKIYHGSTGVFKQGDIWEGKIGMYATAGEEVDGKYIVKGCLLYEINTEKYTMVSYASERMAYNQDRFLFVAGNTYDYKGYILSAKKVESGWKYEVAYDDGVYRSNFLYPPAVGKNYVIINIQNVDETGPQEILYASVTDWQWKKLGEGIIIDPKITDDTAFFSYNNSIWACDLAKSPTNISTGCRKVSREGEKATSPAVKKGNKNLVIYTAESGYRQLYMADLSGEDIVYTKLELEKSADLLSFIPGQWDGDILALDELYQFSEVDVDYRTCYYSISKNKKVCFPNPSPYGNRMGYIYAGVEGKYITYQPTGALVLKDMECYCKEYPDQCLYDEYMPETAPVYVY